MLKSISDLKALFELMELVIVKSTSTFPAFLWYFIVSELAFIQNKQEEEASYSEQQQNKK